MYLYYVYMNMVSNHSVITFPHSCHLFPPYYPPSLSWAHLYFWNYLTCLYVSLLGHELYIEMKGRAERPFPPCSVWPLYCLKLNLAECGQSIHVWDFYYVFSYLWLCWVFITAHGVFLVSASGVYFPLWCTGFFSLQYLLLLRNMGSRSRWLSNQGMWA